MRSGVIPREEEFRARYEGRFGVAIYREWKEKAPLFGGKPFTLDFGITAGRRCSTSRSTGAERGEEAVRKMIRDGVLDGEVLQGRAQVTIRGWDLGKVPRHPGYRPVAGDTGVARGTTLQVVRVNAGVEVVVYNPKSGRAVSWTPSKWRTFAKAADFSKPLPLPDGGFEVEPSEVVRSGRKAPKKASGGRKARRGAR